MVISGVVFKNSVLITAIAWTSDTTLLKYTGISPSSDVPTLTCIIFFNLRWSSTLDIIIVIRVPKTKSENRSSSNISTCSKDSIKAKSTAPFAMTPYATVVAGRILAIRTAR